MDAAVILLLVLKAAVVGLAVYPLVRPGSSHFAGKAMGFRAIVYPGFMLLIPAAWLLSGRPSPYPVAADILGPGDPVPGGRGRQRPGAVRDQGLRRDPAPGGLALSVRVLRPCREPDSWTSGGSGSGWCWGLGAVLDVVWEIGEYLMMRSGASGLDLTYENTIQDLAMSLTGAALAACARGHGPVAGRGDTATLFGWS